MLSNSGSDHPLGADFEVLGLQLSGLTTGQVFLFGIVVGFTGMLGLSMIFGTLHRRMLKRQARRDLSKATQGTSPASPAP